VKSGAAPALAPELDEAHPVDRTKLDLIDAILSDQLAAAEPRPPPPAPRIYDSAGHAFAAARAEYALEMGKFSHLDWRDRTAFDRVPSPAAVFDRLCFKHIALIKDDSKRDRALGDYRAARDHKRFGPKMIARAFAKLINGWQP
jgi:hypothetical protein